MKQSTPTRWTLAVVSHRTSVAAHAAHSRAGQTPVGHNTGERFRSDNRRGSVRGHIRNILRRNRCDRFRT